MSEWKKVKLRDCCHSISDGDHLPPPKSESGVPFITIANIDATNHIDFGSTMFVPFEYYENLNDIRKARCNDILYSVVGSFGKPVLIKENKSFAFQRHIAILRPNNEIADSHYLYYVMLSRDFYMQADTVAIGAAQRTISLTALRNMEVELPPMEIQLRIATILSRYDSLIENYQKQIKLLEEAAQRLYKEWFVDLHFPGHENTKIVNGVPEGWEKKKVREIGKVITGKTPSTSKKEYYGGQIPFITIPDMHTGIYPTSSQFLSDLGANSQSGKFIPANSLMVSCIGTAGLVCITKEECQTNQQINSLVLNDNSLLYYMYNTFLSLKEHLNNIGSNGATMTNVNKSKFESIEILIPNNSISNLYNKAVEQSFRGIKTLSSQICLLTEARDRLLPKLMSGEIDLGRNGLKGQHAHSPGQHPG